MCVLAAKNTFLHTPPGVRLSFTVTVTSGLFPWLCLRGVSYLTKFCSQSHLFPSVTRIKSSILPNVVWLNYCSLALN